MALYTPDILRQFQKIYQDAKTAREYSYTVQVGGECTITSPGKKANNKYILTADIYLRVLSSENNNLLHDEISLIPFEYSQVAHCTVSRKGYTTVNRANEVLLHNDKYLYRKPSYNLICKRLVDTFKLPDDTHFEFVEGTYRRDGNYFNRIVAVKIILTKESERIYHINQMFDLLG